MDAMSTCESPCPNARTIFHTAVEIVENVPVAERTCRIRIRAPEIAGRVQPGQFVMLRLAEGDDPLLGRPFGVYRAEASGMIDLVYLVVGKMTGRLAKLGPGAALTVWGPLGNGWDVSPEELAKYDHFVLVAGGIGQTPLYMPVSRCRNSAMTTTTAAAGATATTTVDPPRWTLLYGAQTASRISCIDDFRALGVDVRLATDDGSTGYQGYVSDLIPGVVASNNVARTKILACGPQPMLHAVFREAERLGVACAVSLESNMSCGLGICYGCVVEYRDGDTWDYRRTCVDGPVFDAYRLRW